MQSSFISRLKPAPFPDGYPFSSSSNNPLLRACVPHVLRVTRVVPHHPRELLHRILGSFFLFLPTLVIYLEVDELERTVSTYY